MATHQEPALITEYENAKIVDYRDHTNPNNMIAITCEHAYNALPDEYSWTEDDEKYFAREHWGYDPGAIEMAIHLASELKCVLVHSLYSRILLDVNRDILSETLFRKAGNGRDIEMNQDLSRDEELKRINKYLTTYYNALREVDQKINPPMVISVHSFTPNYEDQIRQLEIGVLFKESDKLGEEIYNGVNEKGYNVKMNEPWPGDIVNACNSLVRSAYPPKRESICFEFRNDLLLDSQKAPKIMEDMADVLRTVCENRQKTSLVLVGE